VHSLVVAVVALVLQGGVQDPPKMPDTTRGAKRCQDASRYGSSFRVYIVRGARRITCRRARRVAAFKPPGGERGWTYFDWTKGGNGPWSDVYRRTDRRVIVGAIIRGYD